MTATSTTSTPSATPTAAKRPTKPLVTEAAMVGMLREAIARLEAAKALEPPVLAASVKGVVWRARLRASCNPAVLSADAQRRRDLAKAWNEAMATEHARAAACDSAFETLAGAQRWAAAQDKSLRASAKPWLTRAKTAAKAAAKKTARLAQREAADRKRFTEAALRLRQTMAEAAAQRTM